MTADEPDRTSQRSIRHELVVGAPLLLIVVLVMLDVFTIRFVAREHALYRADQLAYWSYSSRLAGDLRRNPIEAVEAVAASVAHSDLNLLPAVPIAGAMLVLGDSRVAYLLSVIDLYGLALLVVLVAALARSSSSTRLVLVGVVATLLLLPGLWRPVFIGYLDIGGVALGLAVLAIYLRGDYFSLGTKELVLLGFLVGLLAVFRRWYGFWSVAFCLVVMVDAGWAAWRSRSPSRRPPWEVARVPVVLGLSAAATVALLAAPIAVQRLRPGYTEAFAAYAASKSVADLMGGVIQEYGLFLLAIVAGCAAFLAVRPHTRRLGLLIPLHLLVTYTMMVSVQDHTPQHWYLYSAGILLLVGTGLIGLLEGFRPSRRPAAIVGILAVGGLLSLSMYSVRVEPLARALGPLVPANRVRPIVREDIEEVVRLIRFLDQITTRAPGYVYVLGSSGTLSEQTLAFANLSLGTNFSSPYLILQSSHVDLRDGFPDMLLEAAYVVVPRPAQWDMRAADHQVVIIPAASFHEGENIAAAFEPLPEGFELRGGVEVAVYRKTRPILPEEIAELSALLRAKYPDRPDIYLPRSD
jgi:hypothetical protein